MSRSEIQDQPWAIIIFGGYWAAPLAVGTDRFMRCFGNPTDQTKSVLVGNRFPNVISRSLQANQLDCFWVCPDNSIFWDHEQCSTSIGSSFPNTHTHTHTHTHRWVLFSRATTTAPPRESHLFSEQCGDSWQGSLLTVQLGFANLVLAVIVERARQAW